MVSDVLTAKFCPTILIITWEKINKKHGKHGFMKINLVTINKQIIINKVIIN